MTLIDVNSDSQTAYASCGTTARGFVCNTFQGKKCTLEIVQIYMGKNYYGTYLSEDITISIYEMTGEYGVDGIPTGSPIATSDPFNVYDFGRWSNYTWRAFYFSGANKIELENKKYCLVVNFPNSNDSYYLRIGLNSSSHGGNRAYSLDLSSWGVGSAGYEVMFAVNGAPIATEVEISGNLYGLNLLTGNYDYDLGVEGISTYQRYRNGVAISGATSQTYQTVLADLYQNITFGVIPKDDLGDSGDEAISSPVSPQGDVPSVDDIELLGDTIIFNILLGSYNYSSHITEKNSVYKRYRDNIEIEGVSTINYTTSIEDLGKEIKFSVIPKNSIGEMGTEVKSSGITIIGDIPSISNLIISGTPKVGETLIIKYDYECEISEGISTYQRYRNGVAIDGANIKTYKIKQEDWNVSLKFSVTVKNNIGETGNTLYTEEIEVIHPKEPEYTEKLNTNRTKKLFAKFYQNHWSDELIKIVDIDTELTIDCDFNSFNVAIFNIPIFSELQDDMKIQIYESNSNIDILKFEGFIYNIKPRRKYFDMASIECRSTKAIMYKRKALQAFSFENKSIKTIISDLITPYNTSFGDNRNIVCNLDINVSELDINIGDDYFGIFDEICESKELYWKIIGDTIHITDTSGNDLTDSQIIEYDGNSPNPGNINNVSLESSATRASAVIVEEIGGDTTVDTSRYEGFFHGVAEKTIRKGDITTKTEVFYENINRQQSTFNIEVLNNSIDADIGDKIWVDISNTNSFYNYHGEAYILTKNIKYSNATKIIEYGISEFIVAPFSEKNWQNGVEKQIKLLKLK